MAVISALALTCVKSDILVILWCLHHLHADGNPWVKRPIFAGMPG